MDYKNGRIYQIRNTCDDDVYVGSTCQALSKRMAWHRENRKATAKQHRPIYVKMKEYGVECFYIELIEEYPCENKEQLRKREGHYIRELGTLNMIQAGRTKQEWAIDNKELIQAQKKEYNRQNKEQIREQKAEYNQQNKERDTQTHKAYYESHKEQIQVKGKKYYEQNKDNIQKRVSSLFECPCGGHCRSGDKARHLKSTLHRNYETTLNV